MTVDVHDTRTLGRLVRRARRSRGLTQIELARTAGLGERFIVDLERGKATCEIGKVLEVMNVLNLRMIVEPPAEIPTADLERDLPRPRRPRRTSKTAP
jgi:y4mF family transcriptional regulator